MSRDRDWRLVFDDVAELYDEARPGYPEELVEDVLALSRIPTDGRILEVGCGPGNATLPFARRGYHILGIELGERLAALAAEHCRPYPDVEILNSAFEDWEVEESAFDLAISAEAFHWIPSEVGYPKVARALKASGSAALWWHTPVDPATEWSRRIEEVHRTEAPGLLEGVAEPVDAMLTRITNQFADSGCFGEVTVRKHSWSVSFTADRYVKQARTWSMYKRMGVEEPARERIFAGMRDAIDRVGGQVDVPHAAALFHAPVKK